MVASLALHRYNGGMTEPVPAEGGPAVLAFGGNALLPDPFHPEDQEERARLLARAVMLLFDSAPGVVLVHGNGPQVGMILLRVEAMRDRMPVEPLDVLVAETQGSVGYLLSRALQSALGEQGASVRVSSILTQVVVDPHDEAFDVPTKPVGPFYDAEEAARLAEARGWHMVESPGEGWRRAVASPRPRRVVELPSIAAAAAAGDVVIAGGGGGIPVVESGAGQLSGVEAVIDKDRTAALLAVSLNASSFVVLTGVPHVSRGFATPRAERIATMRLAEARRLLAAGEFPAGSMGPKVEAACDYVEATRRPALITDTEHLRAALERREGTWIEP